MARCTRHAAVLALLGLVGTLVPLALLAAPAAATPASGTGTLDYDGAGALDDFDLGFTVQVSNTTPAAGDDITVTLTWDENPNLEPFGYGDVNICWDAPVGWAAAGAAPTTQDYDTFTPEGTPVNGQVVGTDVPGTPTATADFASASATGEGAVVTSYTTNAGRVYRFCAHADSIDSRSNGVVDTTDDISGTMSVTLEAPATGATPFQGLLPTGAYVDSALDDPAGRPTDPTYVPLPPPTSPGSTSQSLGGTAAPFRYDYTDTGDGPMTPITVTPTGSLLSYSLDTQAAHGTTVVDPDGTWTYTPAGGFTGDDSFIVEVSDGDGSSLSTVHVAVLPNEADVTVTKSAEESSVLVGEPIHYTIEVATTGALPVSDITVTDPNAPGCEATIPEVAVQDTETVECTYTPTADDVGTYSNVATADSDDLDAPVASNQVDVEVVNAATPRLEIRATTTQTSVEVGGSTPINYEVEVTNTGGVPLTGVAVTSTDAPGCAKTIGTLAVGARNVYPCTLTPTAAMVGNRSMVATADSTETDPVSSAPVIVAVTADDVATNVDYSCSVPGSDPVQTQIRIVPDDDVDPAEPGQDVGWTFRVETPDIGSIPIEVDVNYLQIEFTRPANLQNVALQLQNPPSGPANPAPSNATTTVNASLVRYKTPNSGTIHIDTSGNMTYNGQPVVLPVAHITGQPTAAARGGNILWRAPRLTVNVQTANIGDVPCNPTNTVVASTRVAPENPILDVDKSSVQQAALPGQTVDYTVLVRNRGNVPLTGVAVTDVVASDCDTTVGALDAGASHTINCSRDIAAEDEGRLRNVAVGDSDQTPAVPSNPADVVVSLTAIASLDVHLTPTTDPVAAGDPVEWTITAQNTGNQAITGTDLDTDDTSDCDAQAFPTDLAVGATATVTCTTPTDGAALQPFDRRGTVTNQATVTSNETDPVSTGPVEVGVALPPTGWTDVQPWYAPAADWLDHWDLADGFDGGTHFRGGRSITRGQFLRMVYRLAGTPAPPETPSHEFTDVPDWIADAVAWATEDPDGSGPEAPLMTGLSPTRFGPNAAITRGQAVRLLFRFADSVEPQTVPDPPTHTFTDVPDWVADAVAWAAADPDGDGPLEPLVTGLTATRFGPNAAITRAQVARILYRLADLLDL